MNRLIFGASLLAASLALAACNPLEKVDDKSEDKDDDTKSKKKAKKSKKAAASASADGSAATKADAPKPADTASANASSDTATAEAAAPPLSDVTHPNLGTPEKPVVSPTQQTYAMGNIKPISDTCSKAHVILTQAPESVGVDYDWKYSRQAMLANQQYRIVDGDPKAQGQVSFQVHQANEQMSKAWVLVANCADGVTCNHLAAMYKSVVKSSNPQPFCGDLPPHLGARKKPINLMAGGPQANLPAATDTISKCARLAACTIADKTDTTEDVGIKCQKAPTSFKLDCATRYPCAEVMACLK